MNIRLIKLADVIKLTSLSRAFVYRKMDCKEHPFPICVRIGGRVAWIESEMQDWLEEVIRASKSDLIDRI